MTKLHSRTATSDEPRPMIVKNQIASKFNYGDFQFEKRSAYIKI